MYQLERIASISLIFATIIPGKHFRRLTLKEERKDKKKTKKKGKERKKFQVHILNKLVNS